MPRHQRPHVPGGTYYIVQKATTVPIFWQPDDYVAFERVLPGILRRTGARVHAYCWTPHAIHLVLQIEEISVGRFMQGLTARYARHVQRRTGKSVRRSRYPYQSALIDANHWLLRVARYLHHLPVLSQLAEEPSAYTHSSHKTYAGESEKPWLYTRAVVRQLGKTYEQFMSRPPSLSDVEVLEHQISTSLVIGGDDFLATLRGRVSRTNGSLDEIIETVTSALGVKREHVLSRSRNREPALARALIAWYASERGIATLTDVARRVRRDPSTLSMAISRYRVSRPELFKLNALHYVIPSDQNELAEESDEPATGPEQEGCSLRDP